MPVLWVKRFHSHEGAKHTHPVAAHSQKANEPRGIQTNITVASSLTKSEKSISATETTEAALQSQKTITSTTNNKKGRLYWDNAEQKKEKRNNDDSDMCLQYVILNVWWQSWLLMERVRVQKGKRLPEWQKQSLHWLDN